MAFFIYTGAGVNPPLHTKAFDVWFDLNGEPKEITNQKHIEKLEGNPSFLEFDSVKVINSEKDDKFPDDLYKESEIKEDVVPPMIKTKKPLKKSD